MSMLQAIIPQSDRLNADDLLGGPLTIKITEVRFELNENKKIRPVISYEGDDGKPYKVGMSMARVILHAWGNDHNSYVARYITLYRDEKVKFGGIDVGGIRISHMSHIKHEIVFALTISRAVRKPFVVKPLILKDAPPPKADETAPEIDIDAIKGEGMGEASKGTDALRAWWGFLGAAKQKAIGGAAYLDDLKVVAAERDAMMSGDNV